MLKREYTLIFVQKESNLLLGYKKRGFGEGKWNGFGGKLENNETIEQCAIRELKEECGLVTNIDHLIYLGLLHITYMNANPTEQIVHVFKTKQFTGEIIESDEMRPKWFDINQIPFEHMWSNDKMWFPLMIKDQKFNGNFTFNDQNRLIHFNVEEESFN